MGVILDMRQEIENRKCAHYITDRYHPLPEDYVPEDLVRAAVPVLAGMQDKKRYISEVMQIPLVRLFQGCMEDGLCLMGISGFRSYERQKEIYEERLRTKGREYTMSHIAMPGTSEHQTGLAIDVSCRAVDYELCEEFEYTPEGIWLKKHAWEYGFVFSFTRENQKYTGYVNEPWHIRYVYDDTDYFFDVHNQKCMRENVN